MLLPLEIAAVTSTVAVLTVVALALDAQNRRNQWRHRSTSQLVSPVQLASVVQTVPEDDTVLALTSVVVPLAARDAQTLRSQLAVVQTVPEDDTAVVLTSVAVPLAARDAQALRGLVWWLTCLNSAHGPLSLYTSARNERTVRMGC